MYHSRVERLITEYLVLASVERPPPSVLCVLPSCGQVKIVQQIYYIYLVVFLCGYVRILLPVAICTVIFVTYSLLGHLR